MQSVVQRMMIDMKKGLTGEPSTLLMSPSFTDVPTTNITQKLLAIDFGGTNIRVLLLDIQNNNPIIISQHSSKLDITVNHGSTLFSSMAAMVKTFVDTNGITKEQFHPFLACGFTFSYPSTQNSLSTSILQRWTKEIDIPDVIGADVGELLQNSLNNHGLDFIKIVAICNDTVGTLCTKAISDRNTMIGVILGTGSNAAYREETKNITKLSPDTRSKLSRHCIINIEFGAFDGFPNNEIDDIVFEKTKHLGQQPLEKKISGRYIAMLARCAVRKAIEIDGIFSEHKGKGNWGYWDQHHMLTAEVVDEIERDASTELAESKKKIAEMAGDPTAILKTDDIKLVQKLFHEITVRSGKYAGIAISGVCSHILTTASSPPPSITIAIDGSLFRYNTLFRTNVTQSIEECMGSLEWLNGKVPKIVVVDTEDGSGIGAAIIAATNSVSPIE